MKSSLVCLFVCFFAFPKLLSPPQLCCSIVVWACLQCPAWGLVIPRSFENRSHNSLPQLPFALRCDWTVRDLGPSLQPLVEDVDLDGRPDVFANTLDGSLLGILRADLMNPDEAALADEEPYRWTHFHHRHQYLTNPVTVGLPWRAEKVVLFASADGILDVFEVDGQLLDSIQLPAVYLHRSWFEDARGQNSRPLSSYLSWVDRGPRHCIQLTPRILATPLPLPPGLFTDESWPLADGRPPLSPLALLVPVTYLPGRLDSSGGGGEKPPEDLLLAGLFGLTVCALAPSAGPCLNLRRSVETGQFFLPLELDKLSDHLPAYLLSTPTLGRGVNVLDNADLGGISYSSFFLLSSGSGLLHRLSLDVLLRHSLDYWSSDPHANSQFAPLKLLAPISECLLVDCPSDPDQLCCLLSEAGSRLTLLGLRQHAPAWLRRAPPVAVAGPGLASGRVVWRFELPLPADSVAAAAFTVPVPTIVPSEEPVVLLPDALGNIHAVFLKDGTPLQGSPVANPFRNDNNSNACSTVLSPGVAVVDGWLRRYVVFFSKCGLTAAFDVRGNLTWHNILEEALDSAEVLSSLHEWFDQRQGTSHSDVGSPYRDLLFAPSAHTGALKGSRGAISTGAAAAIGGEQTEAAFLLPSHEGDLQFVTSFRKNSSFRSMFFAPCVNVQASLKRMDATGLGRLSPVPTLRDVTMAGDPLLSIRIFDCLSFLRRDLPKRQDFESHPSYLVQIVNTEGLPLVPLQTAKCLPVMSAPGNLLHGANLSACEINVPLDLSRAPLIAAPKGRITLLLYSLSGRPLVTSDVQLESATVAVQHDTSLSSWLLVFSYLPIVVFTGIIILFLPSQGDPTTTFSNYHF